MRTTLFKKWGISKWRPLILSRFLGCILYTRTLCVLLEYNVQSIFVVVFALIIMHKARRIGLSQRILTEKELVVVELRGRFLFAIFWIILGSKLTGGRFSRPINRFPILLLLIKQIAILVPISAHSWLTLFGLRLLGLNLGRSTTGEKLLSLSHILYFFNFLRVKSFKFDNFVVNFVTIHCAFKLLLTQIATIIVKPTIKLIISFLICGVSE